MNREDRQQGYIDRELSSTPPEGCDLRVGDTVTWVNDYGVKWTNKVIGFNTESWYNRQYSKFVHLDTDSYWFPHSHLELTKVEEKTDGN